MPHGGKLPSVTSGGKLPSVTSVEDSFEFLRFGVVDLLELLIAL